MSNNLPADVLTALRNAEYDCRNYAEAEKRKCVLPFVYVSDAEPVGAPRQIKRDLWKPRVGVVKYRAFKDILKLQVGPVPDAREVVKVEIVALFATPPSWRRSKRERLIYTQHQQTPDADNVGKAVLDTMWPKNDSAIAWVETQKFWADRNGLVISIWRKAGE